QKTLVKALVRTGYDFFIFSHFQLLSSRSGFSVNGSKLVMIVPQLFVKLPQSIAGLRQIVAGHCPLLGNLSPLIAGHYPLLGNLPQLIAGHWRLIVQARK
ncbi:MAG: hypothetical protein LBC51_05430, partial [Treponema sp.]|nr:hypothetical protein [Treponema sp.]